MKPTLQPDTPASAEAALQPHPMISGKDTNLRFKISTLLRSAENEIDELHGMYIGECQKNVELTKALAAAEERAKALEAKVAALEKVK
jgi:hypothetical protein